MRRKSLIYLLTAVLAAGGSLALWRTGLPVGADAPDLTVNVRGRELGGGPISTHDDSPWDGELWYPGAVKTGVLRINNSRSVRIRVSGLGITLRLEKKGAYGYEHVEDEKLLEKYAKNMKLSISRRSLSAFRTPIYDKSFYEMLFDKDGRERREYELPAADRFDIERSGHADLEYTVRMAEEAGNDLQGLRSTVAFLVRAEESPGSGNTGRRGNKGGAAGYDVSDGNRHWAHDCTISLMDHGILEPYEDGTVRPDSSLTRAEAAELLVRALKPEAAPGVGSPYTDLLPLREKSYIVSASEAGLFVGYPDGSFRPYSGITREEISVVLAKAFGEERNGGTELAFADREDIGPWARDYVKAAVARGLMEGYPDGTFRPRGNITRAEAFVILCRALGYHEEHRR